MKTMHENQNKVVSYYHYHYMQVGNSHSVTRSLPKIIIIGSYHVRTRIFLLI